MYLCCRCWLWGPLLAPLPPVLREFCRGPQLLALASQETSPLVSFPDVQAAGQGLRGCPPHDDGQVGEQVWWQLPEEGQHHQRGGLVQLHRRCVGGQAGLGLVGGGELGMGRGQGRAEGRSGRGRLGRGWGRLGEGRAEGDLAEGRGWRRDGGLGGNEGDVGGGGKGLGRGGGR